MRKTLRRACDEIGRFFYRLGGHIYRMPDEARARPWFRDQGDSTLRLDYDLNADSLVVDVGGYLGQWSSDVFAMYGCTIHIFEPASLIASRLQHRFARNPKILVHPCALAKANGHAALNLCADGSSLFKTAATQESITLVEADCFLREQGVERIDLIKINIEGAEYDLLEHLIAAGWMARVVNLQVQFHDCVPDAAKRLAAIEVLLKETHDLTWRYPWVWENWRRRDT